METLGVAEAKRRFSELAERVGKGESFVVVNRGRPVVALVPPQRVDEDEDTPLGLAAFAGILAGTWDTIEDDMAQVIAMRAESTDRAAPDLE
jgi:prevent-host-death family protein